MSVAYKRAITVLNNNLQVKDVEALMRETSVKVVAMIWEKPVQQVANAIVRRKLKDLKQLR